MEQTTLASLCELHVVMTTALSEWNDHPEMAKRQMKWVADQIFARFEQEQQSERAEHQMTRRERAALGAVFLRRGLTPKIIEACKSDRALLVASAIASTADGSLTAVAKKLDKEGLDAIGGVAGLAMLVDDIEGMREFLENA